MVRRAKHSCAATGRGVSDQEEFLCQTHYSCLRMANYLIWI